MEWALQVLKHRTVDELQRLQMLHHMKIEIDLEALKVALTVWASSFQEKEN